MLEYVLGFSGVCVIVGFLIFFIKEVCIGKIEEGVPSISEKSHYKVLDVHNEAHEYRVEYQNRDYQSINRYLTEICDVEEGEEMYLEKISYTPCFVKKRRFRSDKNMIVPGQVRYKLYLTKDKKKKLTNYGDTF